METRRLVRTVPGVIGKKPLGQVWPTARVDRTHEGTMITKVRNPESGSAGGGDGSVEKGDGLSDRRGRWELHHGGHGARGSDSVV